MISVLLDILYIVLIIFAIIVVLGLSYWAIWKALFSPVRQLNKYEAMKLEAEREYHVIEVENVELQKLNAEEKEKYSDYAVKIADLKLEADKLEQDIKRKQKIVKEHKKDFEAFNQWKALQNE
jgi:iron-sulfur cluster repair protein YtfE (RIC family)